MLNSFCKKPLWKVTRDLVACAQGRRAADVVIEHAVLVNVLTAELQPDTSVAFACGRIAYVGPSAAHCIGEHTQVVDATGLYLAPGFLDGHIHVESSMVSVGEYARATVPHGTVGIYWDPHEVCNVLGLAGVRLMAEDARRVPLKAMITTPSCVPAVPGFEDTGSSIDADDIRESMEWDEVVGLGEMMNFPGILAGADLAHDEVAATLAADKIVTGHYSVPETDRGLNAYAAAGIRCCHESTRALDAVAKMRLGMYAQFREGSAWRDLHELARAITEAPAGFDTRFACLVTDDVHPNTLVANGHLDHVVRRAVEEGIDIMSALQMVTINTAQSFRMDHELGCIAPGRCADAVLIDDLERCRVVRVFIDGEEVARDGAPLFEFERSEYPAWALSSMHVRDAITPATFAVPAPADASATARARVIEVIPGRTSTIEAFADLPIVGGCVQGDSSQDVLKTFVFERHHETGSFSSGFVKGFGITDGAMASTVAHDAHNLLVLGTNDDDMALAANTLIACGGGSAVVAHGEVLACVPLPFAGLMSLESVEYVASLVEAEERAWEKIGCMLPSPFMTMALIPLACLPELRLTDRGLVDCRTFEFTDVFVAGD